MSQAYQALRKKHVAHLNSLLVESTDRLSWFAEELHRHREQGLRKLVEVAKNQSPWHQARLAGIAPEDLTEADLTSIPPMTKADLMEHWDRIVTDRRLTLDLTRSHLANLTSDDYLLDGHHAVTSGGSTRREGVFVYDWHA